MAEPRRAASIDELQQKMAAMTRAATQGTAPFRPRPDDVIIAPFGKCGTTWLQQIFHTLRTRGDMDFDDISRVVPWIETAPLLGIDLDAPQRATPRGFKSHLSWDDVPKGARYLVSIRDPRDALVSAYRFMEGWFLEPGTVSLDEFAVRTYLRGPAKRYWVHLASWWSHRLDDNVLLLAYEHMQRDSRAAIQRIARFCGIDLDDELLAMTLEHSSLAFMLAHRDRFDDRMMRELSERTAGLPPGGDSSKVRVGRVGGHRTELSETILEEMDAIWRQDIELRFGIASYADMVAALDH